VRAVTNSGSQPSSGERPESQYSHAEEQSTRVSRWASIVYLAIALAAPVLVYSGPDVMSPATPAFAAAAIDGHLSLHRDAPGALAPTAAASK
jgi:hypothetical protein